MTLNQRLLDAAIHRAIDTHQYSEGVIRRLMSLLNRADADLFEALARALERLPMDSFTVSRLDQLIQSARFINAEAYAAISGDLVTSMRALIETESGYQYGLFRALVPADVLLRFPLVAISVEQAYAAAMSRPFQGRLLGEWAASIGDDRMRRIREAIRVGYVSNESTSQIIARIRGTRARQYLDGIIETDRRSLRAVVNTAISHTSATARAQFYQGNIAILKAVGWKSTLDTKTSHICQTRDGKMYTADDKHKPIGHDLAWLGGPGRAHWNCRSIDVPVVKSWKELTGSELEGFSSSTRASMDGQVPADLTYGEWLQRQSAARQDEVLGRTRAMLMRSGKLPWAKMFDRNGQFISLATLQGRMFNP